MYAEDFAATGSDGRSVRARLDAPGTLESLLAWPAERWAQLCRTFLSENPGVTVVGRPSKAAGEKVQAEDAARIELQKKSLGTDGLKKKGKELSVAEEENDVETPEEVSAEFKIPDVGQVQLIATWPTLASEIPFCDLKSAELLLLGIQKGVTDDSRYMVRSGCVHSYGEEWGGRSCFRKGCCASEGENQDVETASGPAQETNSWSNLLVLQ